MIRQMEHSDLDAVLKLEQACFKTAWTLENFAFELDSNPYARAYVLEEHGEIAGFAIEWITFETAQLVNIAVDPEKRKQGLGQKLLDHIVSRAVEEQCEIISLEVRPSNTAAISLYEKAGFTPFRTIRRYYENGEDAIVMAKGI